MFICADLLSLIAILSPQRQAIQDWARYRYERSRSLWQDLIWSEKSPAQIAIAINLLIATIPLLCWIILIPILNFDGSSRANFVINDLGRIKATLSLGLFVTLMMIYSTISKSAQINIIV